MKWCQNEAQQEDTGTAGVLRVQEPAITRRRHEEHKTRQEGEGTMSTLSPTRRNVLLCAPILRTAV